MLPIGMTSEAAILAKAAALGLEPPAFKMHEAADLFAGWADRVAEADSLRASGRPYLAALGECDRHLGRPETRVPRPAPTILPLSDWLGALASALGAPGFYDQVAKPSCRPAPKVGFSCSCVEKVTIRYSDSDVRSSYPHPMQPVTAGFPGKENSGSSPRTSKAAVAAPMT